MNKNDFGESDQKYRPFDVPEVVAETRKSPGDPFMKKLCCFSLRTGCLIFGYLNLILQTTACVSIIFIAYVIPNQEHSTSHVEGMEAMIYILSITLVILLIMVISQLALLTGVYKKYVGLLQGFVIVNSILLISSIIGTVVNFSTGHISFKSEMQQFVVMGYVFCNIIVVYCYSKQLKIELAHTPTIENGAPQHPIPPTGY